jgi:hypothetical protein
MDRRMDTERAGGLEQAPGRLPNFIIIGAAKGGTTSLLKYLAPHPDVYMASEEIHFFDRDRRFSRGPAWYRQRFAGAGDQKVVGEKTPGYLADPQAPERMWALVPDAKLAAILRNPVDRAYSHYSMKRMKHTASESFEELARREMADPDAPPPRHHRRYLMQGRYIDQLKRLTEFFPRSSVMVMMMEDLIADPAGVVASLYRFLEIDESYRPPVLGAAFNVTNRHRSERLRLLMLRARAWKRAPRLAATIDRLNRGDGYPALDPALRAELVEWFRPANAELARWLERDLSVWDS